jgi:DNA-binding beta-propeller fold protein YncE
VGVMDVAEGPDGSGWAIGSDRVLYRQDLAGNIEPVLDIAAYQETDPDPFDQEGEPTESNPYGLAILSTGDALVADAAGNDLLRVTPDGDASTMARFDVESISTSHLPPEEGLPARIDAEAVPTTVTIGPDGWVYVGELKGFPFRPRTSRIWRIDPNADGALCSVNTPTASCARIRGRFTAIQDIAFNRRTSTLYVYQFAADGVLAFEAGFESGEFPPAVLLKVRGDERTRLAVRRLSQPGGVVVTRDGRVFVTDGLFSDGRLIRLRG